MQNQDVDIRQMAFAACPKGNGICNLIIEYEYIGYLYDIETATDDDAAFVAERINWDLNVDAIAYVRDNPYDEIDNIGDLIEDVLLFDDANSWGNKIISIERSIMLGR